MTDKPMIDVQNICPVGKGCILATCSVHIVPFKITLHEVKIFEKGARRWIGLPAREKMVGNDKTYIELITFDNESVKNKFRDQIMGAIDKYLELNPSMKMDDVISLDAACPF